MVALAYPANPAGVTQIASGLLLYSVAPPYTAAVTTSNTANGVILQYGQTSKKRTRVQSAAAGVYMGRDQPVLAIGRYDYITVDLAFRWPSFNQQTTPGYYPGRALDGATTLTDALYAVEDYQLAKGTPNRQSWLVALQDPSGVTTRSASAVIYGFLDKVVIEPMVGDYSTWTTLTATFTQIGVADTMSPTA